MSRKENNIDIFVWIYFLAIVVESVIRAPLQKKRKAEKMKVRRVASQEKGILFLLLIAMLIVPLVYAFSDWLNFADYALPVWAGWLGAAILAGALYVFWRAHTDLGLNWSPTLEIREKHQLITSGIYGVIRHPMYASQWLWVIAQPLLLQNWVAGWMNLLIFVVFYAVRVKAEERMMIEQFGDEYRAYMQKVGAVFPKFS